MAITQYKVTFIFSLNGQGWTESYYLQTPNTITPQQVYDNYASILASFRQSMLATNAFMDYVRVSTVGVPFSAQSFKYAGQGLYSQISTESFVALLVRCVPVQPGPQKNIFIRGMGVNNFTGTVYQPSAEFIKAFSAFKGYIQSNPQGAGWGFLGTNESTKLKALVTGYTVGVGNLVTVSMAPLSTNVQIFAGIPLNTKINVRFTGINQKSELNGTQVVTVTTDHSCTTVKPFGVIPFAGGGTCTYQLKQFNGFLQMNDTKVTERKTGKELFLLRGRQSNRVRT